MGGVLNFPISENDRMSVFWNNYTRDKIR